MQSICSPHSCQGKNLVKGTQMVFMVRVIGRDKFARTILIVEERAREAALPFATTTRINQELR